jgi:hypothetical protein
MHVRRPWSWVALLGMMLGVPAVACGGRVLGGDDGGANHAATTTTTTGSVATSTTTGSTATTGSSATATSTGSNASSVCAGPPATAGAPTPEGCCTAFGTLPCEAYSSFYMSCPPVAGTVGCPYAVPGTPASAWVTSTTQRVPPGSVLQYVGPASPSSTACTPAASCTCDGSGNWDPPQTCPH